MHLAQEGDSLLLVSLGTGERATPVEFDRAKSWGLLGWSTSLLNVVFDAVSVTGRDLYR